MSRPALIVLAVLSAYCLLDLAVSLLVAVIWRTRAVAPANLPPIVRARRLLQLRLVPAVAAAALTLLVVLPAFAIFEPPHNDEAVGPVFALLSLLALAQLMIAAGIAARSVWLTRRVEREWLRHSQALDASRSAGLRAFAIVSPFSIISPGLTFTFRMPPFWARIQRWSVTTIWKSGDRRSNGAILRSARTFLIPSTPRRISFF